MNNPEKLCLNRTKFCFSPVDIDSRKKCLFGYEAVSPVTLVEWNEGKLKEKSARKNF